MTQTQVTDEGPAGALGSRWRAVAAWTVVGSWGAWALIRLAGADRLSGVGVPAVPLLSLTPYVAALSPLPIGCALLLGRRRAAAAAGVIALALVAAVLPRAFGDGRPPARGPHLRVLTANLYFGEVAPDRLLDLVRRTRPDVLSLQELPPDAVARYERAGLRRLLPHTAVDAREGAAGSGLYSRHPLTALPTSSSSGMAMPRAELTLPGGVRVDVTAVHPPPPISGPASDEWRRDLRSLPAADPSGPVVRVLAGDFNATLDHARFRALVDRGYADAADRAGAGLVPTWGVNGMIPLTIDHVLVDRRVAVHRVTVHDLPGSDHRAVFADLRLP